MRFKNLLFQACLLVAIPVFLTTTTSSGQSSVKSETVKIGLLIPESTTLTAQFGASVAIRNANDKGGLNGVPFQLVVRSMEGPWGTGSKQAVAMIFDEDVVAILGSHDGRNAHLVEQVAAKSRVVFISAWSGDPTLAQAFIPWFFNCVPNDYQQASFLAEEICKKRRLSKIAVISGNDYDSKSALKYFLKVLSEERKPDPLQFTYDNQADNTSDLISRIKHEETDALVLFLQPPASLKIAEQFRLNHISKPVFGSLSLLDENKYYGQQFKDYENFMIVSPGKFCSINSCAFGKEYKNQYGDWPGCVAAYAFDGMNILIEAIRKAGTERESLQRYVKDIRYEGVTGIIQFDDKGNRKGTPVLVRIKNGFPVPLE